MRAMLLSHLASLADEPEPLSLVELEKPEPGPGEILVAVSTCGVCHTELDEIEGRTPPPALPIVPGHQVVGRVVAAGAGAARFTDGDRVGIGWIHASDGTQNENLSPDFVATGRDVNGGYAEFITVPEQYAYPIPAAFSDVDAAPLLCAGGVGFRSLVLAGLEDGAPLGLTGFGGSGHIVLQLARHLYPASPVYVFARSAKERLFAMELGASWAGDTADTPPDAPQAIIDTTPAWKPVLAALEVLRPGGRLVINAIRKEAGDRELMASIRYEDHLWQEKEIKSVANVTRFDLEAFLPLAAEAGVRVETETYPLEDANRALQELKKGGLKGAKVLVL
jgi:propanol-preferring alcohol dehydrogenase